MEVTSHTYGTTGIGARLFAFLKKKGGEKSKLRLNCAPGFCKPCDTMTKEAGNICLKFLVVLVC